MKKLLLIFLLLPTLSFAEWILVSQAESNKKFIDFDEIRIIGDKRRVWVKTEVTDSSIQWKSARAYQEYDCIEKTYILLSLELFSNVNFEGEKTYSETFQDGKIDYVIPNSVEDAVLDAACKIK